MSLAARAELRRGVRDRPGRHGLLRRGAGGPRRVPANAAVRAQLRVHVGRVERDLRHAVEPAHAGGRRDSVRVQRAPRPERGGVPEPAHRGEEVSVNLIDAPNSLVWEEAENRMHSQKALIEFLLASSV